MRIGHEWREERRGRAPAYLFILVVLVGFLLGMAIGVLVVTP